MRPNPDVGTETVYQCYQTLSASLDIKWRMGLGTRLVKQCVGTASSSSVARPLSPGGKAVWLRETNSLFLDSYRAREAIEGRKGLRLVNVMTQCNEHVT